ncbi:uncharacterized protein LOC141905896 isoform X1 [Tubulanus polymorphus]|uniref:uncharacterized protein LOC141905896 isoform X1 n=1 Tax=Tubulanus polymorphus TaxID=672921 RepID=UPI003DA62D5C
MLVNACHRTFVCNGGRSISVFFAIANKMVEAYLGTWEYQHQCSDEDKVPFLDALCVPRELQEKVMHSRIHMELTAGQSSLTSRLETKGGELIQENHLEIGKTTAMKTPDGSDALGSYKLENGKFEGSVKADDVEFKSIMEINGDQLIVTYEISAMDVMTIARFKKIS